MISKNGEYEARMQTDGNFVVYKIKGGSKTPPWASCTDGKGTKPYRLEMQSDNNLVIYDKNSKPTWNSETVTNTGSAKTGYLIMQNDGNLVLYFHDGGQAIWASVTHGGKSSPTDDWCDGRRLSGIAMTL